MKRYFFAISVVLLCGARITWGDMDSQILQTALGRNVILQSNVTSLQTGMLDVLRFTKYSTATQTKITGIKTHFTNYSINRQVEINAKAPVGQTMYIGTTSHAINRGSGPEALTGISSIDGSAAKLTAAKTINGVSFDGTANIQTATANTSDYTGPTSWTPTGTGVVLTVTKATYMQIGKQITATFNVTWPSNSNSGNAVINGLPVAAGTYDYQAGSIGFTSYTSVIFLLIFQGNSYLYITSPSGSFVTNAALSGKQVIGTITYFIN